MTTSNMNRRDLMKLGVLSAAGLALAGKSLAANPLCAGVAGAQPQPAAAKPIRIAHLTDFHIQPEKRAGEGVAACLKHIMSLNDKPDLLITGGDLVMDSFEQEFARTKTLWDLYTKVLKDGCGIPVHHTLGNHDHWGWNKAKSKTTGDEPNWGKKWAMEVLGLSKSYQSFDHGGWKFFTLDSIRPDPKDSKGYVAKLDDEQLDWFKRELDATPAGTPVVVVSHVPILAACAVVSGGEKESEFRMAGGKMHMDAGKLHKLMAGSGKVKLCLSGHIHYLDRIEMDGMTYICDGAVCGSWWNGKKNNCDEGFGVVELRPDGTFTHRYETYGWKAEG